MKTTIATGQLQSARLLRCGVPADTADMHFDMDEERYKGWRFTGTLLKLRKCPAWGLSALLTKVLPHNISVDKYNYKGATEYEVGCYFTGHRDKIAFNAPDPIEACVQLIEWLTENNYKLNEI